MPGRPQVPLAFLLTAIASLSGCTPSAPQTPPKSAAPLESLGEWGLKGDGPGRLTEPGSLAADRVGNVFVTDLATGFVHKLDENGHPLLSYVENRAHKLRVSGKAAQETRARFALSGLAVDRGGAIYVTDSAARRVHISYPDGRHLRSFRVRRWTRSSQPVGVAVDAEGRVFVLESSDRVDRYTSRGRLVRSWGRAGSGAGQFDSPAAIVAGQDDFLYVADAGNHRVQKFSDDGGWVADFAVPEAAGGSASRLAGLAVSGKYLFAADAAGHRIDVWSLEGPFLLSVPVAKSLFAAGRVAAAETPTSLALTRNGDLLAVNPAASNVLRFRPHF